MISDTCHALAPVFAMHFFLPVGTLRGKGADLDVSVRFGLEIFFYDGLTSSYLLKHVENRILSRGIYVVIYEKGALVHRSRPESSWVYEIHQDRSGSAPLNGLLTGREQRLSRVPNFRGIKPSVVLLDVRVNSEQ